METSFNVSLGYYLYESSIDEWMLKSIEGISYSGSFKNVILQAVKIGFELEEISAAVSDMISKDHDSAHFGITKKFLYSFNREFRYGQAS